MASQTGSLCAIPEHGQRRRMKIALVVHDYHRSGGHSRYAVELATRLCKDHEVHVFANRIQEDGTPGIHFHTVPAWNANVLTMVLTFAVTSPVQLGSGFDIVHVQGFCGFYGNVITAHMCNRAWQLALEEFGGGATLRESVFNRIAAGLEHLIYRFSRDKEVIAVSQRVEHDLVDYYGCPARIHVIYHGTDLKQFSPQVKSRFRKEARAQYGIAEDEYVFLFVGNLRKGVRTCIQALSKLDSGFLLCVSGSDPEPYRLFAEECGQSHRVHFGGLTHQVEKAYAAADAFVLPTPYDPFALVVSEAMACGLPVIVSREAGVAELIQTGVNGLVLERVDDHLELAHHMRSSRARPDLGRRPCARWARNSREADLGHRSRANRASV